MILDISNSLFKNILDDRELFLPIRWDGTDFSDTLEKLFHYYIKRVEIYCAEKYPDNCDYANMITNIKRISGLIIQSINHYLNGFPSKAYSSFDQAMSILVKTPLTIYQKSVMGQFEDFKSRNHQDLDLFRVVRVNDNRPYQRSRAFHTPYNLRAKVSTSRYSIAGYPSLYLGTSLELCCKEIQINPYKDLAITSLFRLERTLEYTNANIQVIELGIKPQDFLDMREGNESHRRIIPGRLLENSHTRSAFLLWYPLIAACSYIRVNKNDPFAAEYIVPQLLMQWVRSEIDSARGDGYDQLIGIRYFSCASVKASDMGFNYVFPTSGNPKSAELPYCSILSKAFRLTKPIYIHEYDNIYACEQALARLKDFDFISSK